MYDKIHHKLKKKNGKKKKKTQDEKIVKNDKMKIFSNYYQPFRGKKQKI